MRKTADDLQFKILIERDEDGIYVGSVPELPGCHTQAKNLEILRKRIAEAINLYLDVHQEIKIEKQKSPHPQTTFFGIEDISIQYA